jgi:ribonuclease I
MVSNRDIEKLFDQWNPNKIKAGDRVRVKMSGYSYIGRVVGLDLDLKNKKVYANLRLADNTKKNPCRVDVADCFSAVETMYPGHSS